jgi:hypothetical protein
MVQPYQHPDTRLTLREGLAQFRAANGLAAKVAAARAPARALMDRHDALHVVFGLDTSLRQEALVDLWTVFGTTARLKDMIDYLRLPEEQAILAEIGYWRVAATIVQAIPDAFRVAWAARRLIKKWPWQEQDALLDRGLDELRREFGVPLLAY